MALHKKPRRAPPLGRRSSVRVRLSRQSRGPACPSGGGVSGFAPECPKTARWRRWVAAWLRQITIFLQLGAKPGVSQGAAETIFPNYLITPVVGEKEFVSLLAVAPQATVVMLPSTGSRVSPCAAATAAGGVAPATAPAAAAPPAAHATPGADPSAPAPAPGGHVLPRPFGSDHGCRGCYPTSPSGVPASDR
jgi:hypothetical protein